MITRVDVNVSSRVMWQVASRPSMMGIRTSISITSGCVLAANLVTL